MLVVLFGTSCVGKSTLIKGLVKEYSFNYVSWYTTRPARDNDLGRYNISPDEFKILESKNEFMLVNNSYNFLYGMPLKEILVAIKSDKYYVADFKIKDLKLFESFTCIKIIVLPENETQLLFQITMADRLERKEAILTDYENNLNPLKLREYAVLGCHIFTNYYGKTSDNIRLLYKTIRKIK